MTINHGGEPFADWIAWLTVASAILYGLALYIEIMLVTRPVEVTYWRTIAGCMLMIYLSYWCANNVIWGRLFLYFNVVFSTALVVIALTHLGIV